MKEAFELIKKKLKKAKKIDVCEGMNCRECDRKYRHEFCDTKKQYLTFDKCISIVSEVEAEYSKKGCALCYLGSPCEYQNEDVRIPDELMGWIPCSEKLPKNTDDVLVTTAYGLVIDAYLSVHKNWCFRNGTRITDLADMPIAWMPLPSPFKPEKGE